ncbi:MAG: DMT family transporter [Elusimicrobiota bacterium]
MTPEACGAVLALASAASWALATVLWRNIGEYLTPQAMNLAKTLLGTLFLGVAVIAVGARPVAPGDLLLLAISGLLGIAAGDTFYFMSLMGLGPERAALMGMLTPIGVAVASAAFLGERPSAAAWAGILLTVAGVALVLSKRSFATTRKIQTRGVACALLSGLCMTAGMVFAKRGVPHVPAVQAALIRLACGGAGLALWGLLTGKSRLGLAPLARPSLFAQVAVTVFVTTFGGFWLSLAALQRLDASLVGALCATTPLFVLPMVAWSSNEKISLRMGLGAAVAVGGVALMLVGAHG